MWNDALMHREGLKGFNKASTTNYVNKLSDISIDLKHAGNRII